MLYLFCTQRNFCSEGENVMIHATIKEIGAKAVSDQEPILILFDQTATSALRNYSIIQEISSKEAFQLKKGGMISFDQQEYTIDYVGTMANENLTSVGHVTLIFESHTEDSGIANGIYLSPHQLPELHVGTEIKYR